MRSYKNYLIALLVLTTLAASYMAWSQHREIANLREQLAANQPEVVARKHAWDQQKISSLDAGTAANRPTRSDDKPGEGGQPDFAAGPRRVPAAFREMMDNPEYQKLMSIAQKGRLDRRFAALFKQLNLSPEELEKFKDLLIEKQNAMLDVVMAARDQGLNPRTDREAFRDLLQNTQNDIDASIRATIGDQAYSTYENYERTMPYRGVVDQLATRLSYSSSPLTSAQSEQIVNILADTNASSSQTANPLRAALPFAGGANTSLNAEAMNRAQGILTPAQYSALEQLQQEQQAQTQMRNLIRQQFQPRANPGGGPPPPTG